MSAASNSQFFSDVIAAGAIIAGFCAVFLQFRIQREADYYRNPGQYTGGVDPTTVRPLNLQQFSSSFLLVVLSTLTAFIFGVILPLIRLSGLGTRWIKPQCVVAGVLDAILLLFFYFLDELFHYRILCRVDRGEWLEELPIVLTAFFAAVLFPVLWIVCIG
jgi:hypothetical protein